MLSTSPRLTPRLLIACTCCHLQLIAGRYAAVHFKASLMLWLHSGVEYIYSWHSPPALSIMLDEGITLHVVYTITFMQPKARTSTCVKSIDVSPLTGTAIVEFLTGTRYEYNNVSRKAIANLLAQPNMSLGFWVNANCKAKGVKCREITPASFYKHKLAKIILVQEPQLPVLN